MRNRCNTLRLRAEDTAIAQSPESYLVLSLVDAFRRARTGGELSRQENITPLLNDDL